MHLISQHQLFEPWLQFKHPLVRQLAFAVASPNILSALPSELAIVHAFLFHPSEHWQQHFQRYLPRLRQLDCHPTELEVFIQQLKSTRLGLRFEMFMWFWLLDHRYHAYELLGHSIQIIDGSRTTGELDFLIKNTETNQVEHWEVALKYYLGETYLGLTTWYGLNRTDTLKRKLKHFTQKQFQFQQALDTDIQMRYAVLKGQLFLPLKNSFADVGDFNQYSLPHWLNPDRRLGIWGTTIPKADLNFFRLQRQEWICPNAVPSSLTAHWWTNGLYLQNQHNQFYMYRNSSLIFT
ncbi:DUF1853 family protein [Acinetobacter sp. TUM15064]|uniref:DUF1853 family protein n=1 Tax=Acinetobacter sp. TUM15064 TaxID=2609134 RepID=UPI00124D3152|nr:DUF1853 family protein [Acinetobacter sp. TUM15064]